MKRTGSVLAAAFLAAFALAAPITLAEEPVDAVPSAKLLLARAIDAREAPQCLPGDAGQCGPAGPRLAAGAECPAASGKYCSDELPYCCGTPGNYYCAKDVNSC
ncbi:MAG: hypothetical protein Q8P46_03930 [Hyphomicrobiales bacterium]|nr:hypothetical protein [Hyphomicrobiales bacterium]